MKKILIGIISIALISITSTAHAQENEINNSNNLKEQAFEIGKNYKVGETLDKNDEIIVKRAMEQDKNTEQNGIQPRKLVSGTKKFNKNNGKLQLRGSCNYNFWKSPVSNYYNCKVTASKKGSKNTKATLRHIGYGAGTKGIIKSYDRTFSNSAKKSSVSVAHKESYTGVTGWGVFKGTAKSGGTSVTQTLQ